MAYRNNEATITVQHYHNRSNNNNLVSVSVTSRLSIIKHLPDVVGSGAPVDVVTGAAEVVVGVVVVTGTAVVVVGVVVVGVVVVGVVVVGAGAVVVGAGPPVVVAGACPSAVKVTLNPVLVTEKSDRKVMK